MALPITVPFTFANATTTQNLSSLDADFATVYNAVNGIGNGTVTLSNVNVTGGNISNVTFTGVVTYPENGYQRNRIINGAMMIDQRNAGASITANDGTYSVDRFKWNMSQSSKGTGQQSSTAPAGFSTSLLFTSSSAYTVGASDQFDLIQAIEGLNVADLNWGTANAATVTLSFWVRSSLTGTFGGSLRNSAGNRSYPFTYTINSANTFEQKTITIAGDTSGTWLTTNGVGIYLTFGLGVGATISGAAGAWAGANYPSATGATSVVGTNGATWYITGVQLEVGSVATPFERRQFSQELILCQRYYYNTANGLNSAIYTTSPSAGSYAIYPPIINPASMRTTPTVVTTKNGGGSPDCSITPYPLSGGIRFVSGTTGLNTDYVWTASAEL